jgi:hypothetical protein
MKEEIYEPSLEKEVLDQFKASKVSIEIAGVLPPGVSRLTSVPLFDQDRVKRLMEGAIDMHVHSWPDPYMARLGDQIDLAIAHCQAGLGGILFGEPHHAPSSWLAPQTQKVVNQWADEHGKRRIDVFGGVALNYTVGGLNPAAVVASARIGGKIVWPPGVDSSHYYKLLGVPGGIDVLDENDNVVPAMKEILALIAEGDLVLNMSCLGVKDVFCLIDEAKKIGVKRMNVVHPNQPTSLMTVEQRKIAADKGAFIEMTCVNFIPPAFSWDDFLATYKLVGPDRIVCGSDSGCFEFYTPVVAFTAYITGMLTHGIPDKDVEKMVKTNARELLY